MEEGLAASLTNKYDAGKNTVTHHYSKAGIKPAGGKIKQKKKEK